MDTATKIIVVDDEARICHNVKKILSSNNFEVTGAKSAMEAMEMMANNSYSILISDIVMPGMNGLEFLKLVKEKWPSTKSIMMTAYASTDTAVKAIRLGALDYIPKPFTPEELRNIVNKTLSGELVEATVPEKEKEMIDIIDVDVPFDRKEVAKHAGDDYADRLTRSDIQEVQIAPPSELENYCKLGDMVCDIFKKLGNTCKGGLKNEVCPRKKAKNKKGKAKGFNAKKLIGIDQPFNYKEVVSITGPEYVQYMGRDEFAFLPYEELKKNVALEMEEKEQKIIDFPNFNAEPYMKNILVIDDEVAVSNNIRRILSKEGYHVDQAASKAEAIEKINQHPYKLVLLDLRIPEVKGLELLKTIAETQPNASVIIITGYASIETAVEAARIGAIDYLPKPFTPEEIRVATDQVFRHAA
jgi:DNA-binding response OmpR family regulator